jgi:tRNA A-37 threonylcarbamoyl transferase component Bud32
MSFFGLLLSGELSSLRKVDNEVTVLQYLRQHIQVPVPEVYGVGTCWAGAYIVMAFVEGDLLSNVLKDPL